MKPQRIQRKRTRGWRMPDNTVYVGRTSGSPDWGNPFRVGVDGTAEECVEKFRVMWMRSSENDRKIMLAPLRGKNLACWCPLDRPCHADVLLELANQRGV